MAQPKRFTSNLACGCTSPLPALFQPLKILNRMASIPNSTTINAQGVAPTSPISDVPQFQHVDITPTTIGALTKICFGAQTATDINIPRLPQDLTNFIATGTVTQMILDDPNTVLSNAIAGQNITSFFVFTVSTTPVEPGLGSETANVLA